MNNNEQETLIGSRSTTKKKIRGRFHLGSGSKQRRGGRSGSRGCRSGKRRSRCGRRRRGTPLPRSPSSSRSGEAAKKLGAGDLTHNQPEVVAAAATHHNSPPVSHEGGGRASTEWKKERVESGNPYIKAGEIAAISLRARRPERERRAGTRAKTFPLPARARASHPAGAQNRPRASQTSAARKKRGFRSFPESQAERSSVALRSQAPLRAIDDKHDNLQPTGAAGPPGQGRKRALIATRTAAAAGKSSTYGGFMLAQVKGEK